MLSYKNQNKKSSGAHKNHHSKFFLNYNFNDFFNPYSKRKIFLLLFIIFE